MTQSLPDAMAEFAPVLPLTVAYSGGADSSALLLACAGKWPGQVRALHVNHGLQAAAADFERHCQATCIRLGVPLAIRKVDAAAQPGESPENAARIARNKVFRSIVAADNAQIDTKSIANYVNTVSLALAHHADDQVETLLLALSRGAGLAGLAAMPLHWCKDGIDFYRPLLKVSAAEIRNWLRAQGEPWVEDPTNPDPKFTRNRIRAQLLPSLEAVFPQFRDTFTRSSAHAAQAQGLLDDIAQADLAALHGLSPKALGQLSAARQTNVLRHWLKTTFNVIPSTAQTTELVEQIKACTTRGHQIHIKVGNGFVQRQGEFLTWYNPSIDSA